LIIYIENILLKALTKKRCVMDIMDFLFGHKASYEQVPTMDPQQMQLFQQLLSGLSGGNAGGGAMGSGMGFLQNILSGDTSKFEAPLMRQFNEQTVPGLAERFSGAGAGAQSSGAFGQQLGAAGAGLSENLGALRGGLQMQALGPLMQMLQTGMGAKPFETMYKPETQGFMGAMAPGIGQGLGMGLTGGGMGSMMSSLLKLLKGGGNGWSPSIGGSNTYRF
jgi:hypothetical protein